MTPAHASPEQLEGRPLGTGTDVWSLGVMLHELLSGVRPVQLFDSEHARALAMLSGKAASILASNGSTLDAEDAARRAFELMQTHADGDQLRMAAALAALAYALDSVGREHAAIEAAQTALRLREAAGAGAVLIAQNHVDLCYVASGSGDHVTALSHCEHALALYTGSSATPTNGWRCATRSAGAGHPRGPRRSLSLSGGPTHHPA